MIKEPQTQSAELQAILQNEQAMTAPRAAITKMEEALQKHQEEEPRARAEFVSLKSQLGEVMADIATAASQDRGPELASRRAELERQTAECNARILGHQQTIEGLTSRLESTRTELSALQDKSRPLILALLQLRAEAIGADYVQAAKQLKALHGRLKATCLLMQDLGFAGNLGGGTPLEIPSFHLKSVEPYISKLSLHTNLILKEPGESATHGWFRHLVASVEDELRADGINLDWR